MAAYRRVYDSHHLRLTAKNRDQLRNPTLGNRVWATFTFSPTYLARALGTRVSSARCRSWGRLMYRPTNLVLDRPRGQDPHKKGHCGDEGGILRPTVMYRD